MRLKRKKKRKRRKSLVRLASAESASRGHFDQTFSALSVRARNVLFNASVQDIPAFLAFECETLLQLPNCGRKTAAEIAAFQKRLRSDPPQDTGSSVTVPISFDNAPPGIIDAIRGRLSVRAIHVLQGLSVDDLKGFMALDYARLAGCRSCGKKTVNLILELQRDIAMFANAQAQRDGVFHPESLLDAPCLVSTVKGDQCDTTSDILCADVANPAPWLTAWVLDLAKTERHARVFMLRMGMMGDEPITLEAVAKRLGGLTRERIRQMQKAVAKKAEAAVQQRRLRPLVEAAAAEVARQGGWVRLPDLTVAVLGTGKDGGQLRYATGLMKFFSGLRVWRKVGLCTPQFGTVSDSVHQFGASEGKPAARLSASAFVRTATGLYVLNSTPAPVSGHSLSSIFAGSLLFVLVLGWVSVYLWGNRSLLSVGIEIASCAVAVSAVKYLDRLSDSQLRESRKEEKGADGEYDFVK